MTAIHPMLRAAWAAISNAGFILLFVTRVVAQSRPEPPDLMSFEGNLIGADGAMIGTSGTVNYPMVFRVFDRLVGGNLLWAEQQTVAVNNGRFVVVLGEGSSMGNEPRPSLSSLFKTSSASDRYVDVTVRGVGSDGTDASVAPRVRMASGAFSLLATHARSAVNLVAEGGQSMVTTTGSRIGINQSNPTATLDVNGSVAVTTLVSKGSISGAGAVQAEGFNGLGMAPVGTIVMWTGNTPPRGWVLCDGSVQSGKPTPDLRGRFVLAAGAGQGLSSRISGDVGGVETHALSASELPAHSHQVALQLQVSSAQMSQHAFWVALGGNTTPLFRGTDPSRLNTRINPQTTGMGGAHGHMLDIANFGSATAGEGRPHNNMPPFYVLAFIMRVQ